MEKKFTKWKWTVHHDGVYLDQRNVNYDDRNVADIICHPPDKRMSNASYKKWKYNAKLIAAAPDLLEALTNIIKIVEDSEGVVGYHLNGDTAKWDEFDEITNAIKTIKKATE